MTRLAYNNADIFLRKMANDYFALDDAQSDELKVRLLDDSTRADADIRGIALQSLMWDVEVPSESVDVNVREGWVTLKGT